MAKVFIVLVIICSVFACSLGAPAASALELPEKEEPALEKDVDGIPAEVKKALNEGFTLTPKTTTRRQGCCRRYWHEFYVNGYRMCCTNFCHYSPRYVTCCKNKGNFRRCE
mmetsp:Transcript_9102/g.27390  ORF Transcript_9102/g.27390 Transcript_9102/m.27390 type:complete len:111 (-) Transcript_9102:87-419(-)